MFTVLANMVLQCFHKFLKFCRGQHFFAEEQAVKRIMDRGCWKQDRGSPVVYFSTAGLSPVAFLFAGSLGRGVNIWHHFSRENVEYGGNRGNPTFITTTIKFCLTVSELNLMKTQMSPF